MVCPSGSVLCADFDIIYPVGHSLREKFSYLCFSVSPGACMTSSSFNSFISGSSDYWIRLCAKDGGAVYGFGSDLTLRYYSADLTLLDSVSASRDFLGAPCIDYLVWGGRGNAQYIQVSVGTVWGGFSFWFGLRGDRIGFIGEGATLPLPPQGVARIVSVSTPLKALSGSSFTIAVTVANDGVQDSLFAKIWDTTTSTWRGSLYQVVNGSTQTVFNVPVIMPNNSLNGIVYVGHEE